MFLICSLSKNEPRVFIKLLFL